MMIRPSQNFPIVYLIGDTTDANTYYVQAIIRDTATGNTLSTTNLAGSGRRFSATPQAPADPSGLGRHIDVTTTVYTDVAYTVKSSTYPEQINTYIVQERWNFNFGGGGGGDVEGTTAESRRAIRVDYKKIDAMIKKYVAAIQFPEQVIPDPVSLAPVIEAIRDAHKSVKEIKIPEVPQFPEFDYKRIESAVADHAAPVVSSVAESDKKSGEMSDKILQEISHMKALHAEYQKFMAPMMEFVKRIKQPFVAKLHIPKLEESEGEAESKQPTHSPEKLKALMGL